MRISQSVKQLSLLFVFAFGMIVSQAKDGYKIVVKYKKAEDTLVYLAHYFGEPLPKIYKTDSARVVNGVATFKSNKKTLGGIFIILPSDKSGYFEFVLDNGNDMVINVDNTQTPAVLTFENSPENTRFANYVKDLQVFGEKQQSLQRELAAAKNPIDSNFVVNQIKDEGKKLIAYRQSYIDKYPGTFLTSVFKALEVPIVPEGEHLLPNGKPDTLFAYHYYKNNYWKNFNFHDDRLIQTPLYDNKLKEYFEKLVIPIPDSVIAESDRILAKNKKGTEMFKYTLWWLTRHAETSKIMGMDKVFVYLVNNYFRKGDAFWLDREGLAKYIERAEKIMPNLIENMASDIRIKDQNDQPVSLFDIKAKYTLLIFWAPDCGHCLKEIPKVDSVYKAVLKDKGVKVFAVRTEGGVDLWKEKIKEFGLEDWTNAYDPDRSSNYRSMYDISSTPVIYLLDEKKIIRGKRLDDTNITTIIDMLENKESKHTN